MLKFYYAKNSAAFAPHILLEDIGADYEAVQIDMQSGEQRSESYLAINPKGRLPSLVTDKGILTETPAILLYLAQIFQNINWCLAPHLSSPMRWHLISILHLRYMLPTRINIVVIAGLMMKPRRHLCALKCVKT